MLNKKITFIGAGKMAEAILKGILSKKLLTKNNITLTDINNERLEYISKEYGVNTSMNNPSAITGADVILLAVKPQAINKLLQEIYPILEKQQLILSIVAGVKLQTLDKDKRLKVIRLMPNTPALIGEAMTVITANERVEKDDKKTVRNIFESIGTVYELPENKLNAVTALSGSGPAFVFRLLEAFIDGGMQCGLSYEEAQLLTFQTFKGSCILAAVEKRSLKELIQDVSSPGGTTVAGRQILENSQYRDIIASTLKAAKNRADELASG
jgi:pyrroline-5-carboxylate reductase